MPDYSTPEGILDLFPYDYGVSETESGYSTTVRELINILLQTSRGLIAANLYSLDNVEKIAESNKATKPIATAFPFTPSPIEPIVNIPYNAAGMDIVSFQSIYDGIMDQVVELANTYWNTYFPNENAHLAEVDAWLTAAIQGSVGIDEGIERQIYQRDRDRIEAEYQKALSEAERVWASRGFGMPTGALAGMQFNLRQAADAKCAESSRQIAIKQAEIRIENAKFAIQQAIGKRSAAITASVQYIGALLSGYNNATQFATLQNDGQQKLIAAASDFYKSRIAVEELKFKADLAEAEYQDKATQRYQDQLIEFSKQATAAALEGAKTLASSAASALNALNAGASISAGYSDSTSRSTSTSYNENVSV